MAMIMMVRMRFTLMMLMIFKVMLMMKVSIRYTLMMLILMLMLMMKVMVCFTLRHQPLLHGSSTTDLSCACCAQCPVRSNLNPTACLLILKSGQLV